MSNLKLSDLHELLSQPFIRQTKDFLKKKSEPQSRASRVLDATDV